MYRSKTFQSGSIGLHARRKIEDRELRKDWTKSDLICNEEISLQRPLHDTEQEKLLSPPTKCI